MKITVDNDTRALKPGVYVFHVREDGYSSKKIVEPDFTTLQSALEYFKEDLIEALVKASTMKIPETQRTKENEMVFEEIKAKMGKHIPTYFTYGSIHDTVDTAINDFNKKIESIFKEHNIES